MSRTYSNGFIFSYKIIVSVIYSGVREGKRSTCLGPPSKYFARKYSSFLPLDSKRQVHFSCKMFQFGKPIYADYFLEAPYGLAQGLQTFLSESHFTTVRGPDILRNGIVSGYVIFYEINKIL